MGIIGVVAALTLPNLNSSTGNKEKVAKLQKIQTNLNDAYGRAVSVYGPINTWFAKDNNSQGYSTRFANRMADFLKINKDCGYISANNSSCFKDFQQHYGYDIILSDGTGIVSFVSSSTCFDWAASGISGVPDNCLFGTINVDIDGPNKGKNNAGLDIFQFYISKDGVIPAGGPNDMDANTAEGLRQNCLSPNSYCATGWILTTGNMDYLKCYNSLSWSNTTCK